MTLEKAIELLKGADRKDITPASQEFRDAIRLGIEALKRIHQNRYQPPIPDAALLPGETEE